MWVPTITEVKFIQNFTTLTIHNVVMKISKKVVPEECMFKDEGPFFMLWGGDVVLAIRAKYKVLNENCSKGKILWERVRLHG